MIKAGIIGATGYAGVELVRLLLGHPDFEIAAISSVSFEGKPLSVVYPALRELCDRFSLGRSGRVSAVVRLRGTLSRPS